jgi:hypothetical protein
MIRRLFLDHYTKFYYGLRSFLRKKRCILRFSQIIRSLLILGPYRNMFISYYKKYKTSSILEISNNSLFSDLDVDKSVDNIRKYGYSIYKYLPEEHINTILAYCKHNQLVKYYNPHNSCRAIHDIAYNANIVEVARKYLGVEPILWSTEMYWVFSNNDSIPKNMKISHHKEPTLYDFYSFHYDAIDFSSLAVFIYLTDVDINCAPHIIIEGTHNNKKFSEILNIIIDDDVAEKRYGDKIKVIMGKRGTVFFEETSSYHKVLSCKKERLILKIDYVLRRKSPPER